MSNRELKDKIRRARKRPAARPAARRAAKRRVRPSVRVAARKAAARKRPMPTPPQRRPLRPAAARPARAASPARAAAPSPELTGRVQAAQTQFASLESRAQLSGIYTAVGAFDTRLVELPLTLEALRNRGYLHSEQLEDRLEALEEQWDQTRPRVESTLQDHVARLDKELDEVERRVHSLRPAAPALRTAESMINSLTQRIGAAETAVSGLYAGMETELQKIDYDMRQITLLVDVFAAAKDLQLRETEGPLMAVKSMWQRDGKEGPDGYLFLTDQRLLFEQREEVVTKKRLGIFKAESETIQELLLDIAIADVESVTDKEEGGFLGMGKEDIIELVFSANAPISRGRFHLKGQDSSDWAAMIKRIQSGEIDNDRADEYLEELADAKETALAFPTQCPNCFAPVPTPPRGIVSVTCEFCGATITPMG